MKEQNYGHLEIVEYQHVKNTVNVPAKITLNSNIQWETKRKRGLGVHMQEHTAE